MLKNFLLSLSFFIGSFAAAKSQSLELTKQIKDVGRHASEYLKLHDQFNKKVCTPGTEEKYWELYRDFRGDGHYIPVLGDGKLDRLTVSRFVPEIESKAAWIAAQATNLKKTKNLGNIDKGIASLKERLEKALSLKYKVRFAKDEKERSLAIAESKYAMIALKDAFKTVTDKIPFLLSYKFPVDHFQLRENYDDVKYSEDPKEIQRKNEVYFFRKIVQDGAQNPDTGGSDSFLRAVIDTVAIELEKTPEVIPEYLRHDIAWLIRAIDGHISRYGREKIIKRLGEWESRTKRELEFYIALKNDRVKTGNHFETSLEILSRKEKARYLLKDYVLKKQKEVYEFWARQSELNQAIFSLETILFNEVGRFDGSDALERKDVAQVVINRSLIPRYNQMTERDSLFNYLSQHHRKHQNEHPWLNVMLKEGEFSFTYFFITGSVRVFCPEQTRIGKSLIRENVRLSLNMLLEPNFDFEALRYFSRASMLGRISMDRLWQDYEPIAERPGKPVVRNNTRYRKLFDEGKMTFLYDFTAPNGVEYHVYEFGNTEVVREPKSGGFFTYRNPHYFKYFRPIPKVSAATKNP